MAETKESPIARHQRLWRDKDPRGELGLDWSEKRKRRARERIRQHHERTAPAQRGEPGTWNARKKARA